MIVDTKTGLSIFLDILEITPTHLDATSAYATWASELGVSDTTSLPGLTNTDDGSAEIDLGFSYTIDGTDTKLMQTSEGSIGFYASPSSYLNASRPITGVIPDQVNVTRAYTTRSLNPSMIINCKHPSVDSKSYATKWQKTDDTMIMFLKWSSYNNSEVNRVDFAMKMSKGNLEVVCNTNTNSGAYFQIFLMDSTGSSGQALSGNGNFAKVLLPSNTYQFKTVIPKLLSGVVIGSDGLFASRQVRAYDRITGNLVGSTTSDEVDGSYSITTVVNSGHYVVCLDDSDGDINAIIFDRVIPIG
jgi:hypothetical protein